MVGYDCGLYLVGGVFRNLTWLPFWLTSAKPADSRRRFTSRKVRGLSRANLDFDHSDCRRARHHWRLEMEFQGFFQIRQRLFFCPTLTGDIRIKALCDVPVAFMPDGRWKGVLHAFILAQTNGVESSAG